MTLPKVTYLTPSPHGYVPLSELTSKIPMRLTRFGTDPPPGPVLTYGKYFKGIKEVISKDDFALLVEATGEQLAKDITASDIEEILIYAEKHGSDYHPGRIEVIVGYVCATFVMNVAVTSRGEARLCREFEVLKYLNSKYDFHFLPRTYFQGETLLPSMSMFLADWFQGYHEFHLSMDEEGFSKLILWDTEKNPCQLSRQQAWQIYYQAARILTLYYDIETFEQIYPWHHAAGDFIVKAQGESIEVKLVTARQYASMIERSEGILVHDAMLFFLLNLSLRMRLDRLDGVGSLAWADDDCVGATLEGFMEGLRIKQAKGFIDEGFVNGFMQYVQSFAKEDLSYRFHALINACDPAAPDIPVIKENLKRHVSKFYLVFQDLQNF